jgi:hypothetical protein
MKRLKISSICLAFPVIMGLALSAVSGHAQSASATISDVAVAGGFDYSITLHNTGTFNLQSFWYGWTTSGNNLPSNPSTAGNSLGWANVLSANSIMWGNSSDTPLAPGQSGNFTFFSASTPAAITTPPSGESVAYVGSIDFSQGSPGDSTGIFSPTLVPEPSSIALLAIGAFGLLAVGRRKFRAQST